MTVQRPRVFVSSTIYDLADLRDALKFWLEEMGFDVQMSEFNDFERRPEAGTFEACFESIRRSDYYLLMVGERRGSWYDEPDRTSVTQQEYRVAYQALQAAGRPKIVSFVRRSVLVALREREASKAPARAGSALEDPELTREFIREVRREEETDQASAGVGPYPPANWITEFATFRELTDGLKSTLRITMALPRAAIVENLRHELESNLRLLLTKYKGRPFYRHWWLDKVREQVKITRDDLRGQCWLGHEQIRHAMIYATVATPRPESFVRVALEEAVVSAALLDFDPDDGRYVASFLLKAVYQLRQEVDIYKSRYAHLDIDARQRWVSRWFGVKDQPSAGLTVPVDDVLSLFGVHDSHQNILRLLVGILRYIHNHTNTIDAMLRPVTPLVGEEEKIKAETVSEEELAGWLKEDSIWLRAGLRDYSEEERRSQEDALKALRQQIGEDEFDSIMKEVNQRLGLDEEGDL